MDIKIINISIINMTMKTLYPPLFIASKHLLNYFLIYRDLYNLGKKINVTSI